MQREVGVAIVESGELIRRGLADMLGQVRDARVYEYACADDMIADHEADIRVVIMGAAPRPEPTQDEFDRLRRDRDVLMLVTSSEPGHIAMAARWAADGYLMANEISTDGLREALDRLVLGETPMPREVAKFLLDRSHTPAPLHAQLTPRETEVLGLVIEGLSNKQIALRLGISLHGAKRHVSSIISKLGCTSRTQVVARSLQLT